MGLVPDNPPAAGPGLYLGPRCDRCCAPPGLLPPHGYIESFAEKVGSETAAPPWHSAVKSWLKSAGIPPLPGLTYNVTLGGSLTLLYDGAMPLTVVLIKRRHQQLNSYD